MAGLSYPADGGDLRQQLQGYIDEVEADITPISASSRAIISPHIDYARGGHVYASVWASATEVVREAELIIVLGTDHNGDLGTLTLTPQNYASPLGVLPTDLEIVDKPAMPCMSSRIAYGEEVTDEKLGQVEQAEDILYDLGLRILRVRHHGDTARIEVRPQDLGQVLENRERISDTFHQLGFLYVSLDLDGFKTGSLNKALS